MAPAPAVVLDRVADPAAPLEAWSLTDGRAAAVQRVGQTEKVVLTRGHAWWLVRRPVQIPSDAWAAWYQQQGADASHVVRVAADGTMTLGAPTEVMVTAEAFAQWPMALQAIWPLMGGQSPEVAPEMAPIQARTPAERTPEAPAPIRARAPHPVRAATPAPTPVTLVAHPEWAWDVSVLRGSATVPPHVSEGGVLDLQPDTAVLVVAVPRMTPVSAELPAPTVWRRRGHDAPAPDRDALLAVSSGGRALSALSAGAQAQLAQWREQAVQQFRSQCVPIGSVPVELQRVEDLPLGIQRSGSPYALARVLEGQMERPVVQGNHAGRGVLWVTRDTQQGLYVEPDGLYRVDPGPDSAAEGLVVYGDGTVRPMELSASRTPHVLPVLDVVEPVRLQPPPLPMEMADLDPDLPLRPGEGFTAGFEEEVAAAPPSMITPARSSIALPAPRSEAPAQPELLLGVEEAAELMDMAPAQLRELVEAGTIGSIAGPDGAPRFRWSALMAWRRLLRPVAPSPVPPVMQAPVAPPAPAVPASRASAPTLEAAPEAAPAVGRHADAPPLAMDAPMDGPPPGFDGPPMDEGYGGGFEGPPMDEGFGGGFEGPPPGFDDAPFAFDGPPPGFDDGPSGGMDSPPWGGGDHGGPGGGGGGRRGARGSGRGGAPERKAPRHGGEDDERPAKRGRSASEAPLTSRSPLEGAVHLGNWQDIRPRGALWMGELLGALASWDDLERWGLATDLRLLQMGIPLTKTAKQRCDQIITQRLADRLASVRIYSVDGKDHFVRPDPSGGALIVMGPRGKPVPPAVRQSLEAAWAAEQGPVAETGGGEPAAEAAPVAPRTRRRVR